MPKLYACIISANVKRDKEPLVFVARQFSYAIEMLVDGILFDVSGLERLIGKPDVIAQRILDELGRQNISGKVAVADTVETAKLLARGNAEAAVRSPDMFPQLPLSDLPIEQDTLNVFADLGLRNVEDLLEIPGKDLIARYGREFEEVINIAGQKGSAMLRPNVKEKRASWDHVLDSPVEDFEQLIFLLNHGLDKLFGRKGWGRR